MYFNVAALALPVFFLGRVVFASPVGGSTGEVAIVKDTSSLDAAIYIDTLSVVPGLKGLPTTSSNSDFRAFVSDSIPELIVCNERGCLGNCYISNLTTWAANKCYASYLEFGSAMVRSDAGSIPYDVFVSYSVNCYGSWKIPLVNTCYDLLYNNSPAMFATMNIN